MRRFGAEAGEAPMQEPSFLTQQGSASLFWPISAFAIATTTAITTANTSIQIYYPDETEALVMEYKQGLRNADYSPKDE